MTVDTVTALHAERDGKTFHFCSDHFQKKPQSMPAGHRQRSNRVADTHHIPPVNRGRDTPHCKQLLESDSNVRL